MLFKTGPTQCRITSGLYCDEFLFLWEHILLACIFVMELSVECSFIDCVIVLTVKAGIFYYFFFY